MATAMLKKKNVGNPDDIIRLEKDELAVINVSGATVARAVFGPGWRWSMHVGAGMGQKLCQVPHLGYVESGHMAVEMSDGARIEMGPGDTAYIPAGHDGWTVGEERCVFLEFPPPSA